MDSNNLLKDKITERAKRRKLTVSIEKMRYANESMLNYENGNTFKNALYVGVGHGHDVLLSLMDEFIENAVGVDPYCDKDGNPEHEYEELISNISELKLDNRFSVVKSNVEDYLKNIETERFDLVVLSDVLHHIFVSRAPLAKSSCFIECIKLFSMLKNASLPGAVMIIHDMQRHGLRPWLSRIGIPNSKINYKTKQNEQQWIKAAQKGGWYLDRIDTYVPHALRNWGWVLNNQIGRYTLSNRYTVYFVNKD